MKLEVADRLREEFGEPTRDIDKVTSWNLTRAVGIVFQKDSPKRDDAAFIWLPYPGEGQPVPEMALEYPGESGRHSNTHATAGLARGEPALKLIVRTLHELDDVIGYIRAMAAGMALPEVKSSAEVEREHQPRATDDALGARPTRGMTTFIDPAAMPEPGPAKRSREAIPRRTLHEVWQRDGGRCVACSRNDRLCVDHVIPVSKGGGNSARNLQLLCERCNLAKGSRI